MRNNSYSKLSSLGYKLLGNPRLWTRNERDNFSYSDGDQIETHLENEIASTEDLTLFSKSLRQKTQLGWPFRYHLSFERSNVLRPFESLLKGKVLEIGAGCGAITRYLGETGAEVFAIEGSLRRARIAARRTRDLDNVKVIAENFEELPFFEKFDVVTVIGVLEYASMFNASSNPFLDFLNRARKFLKPRGVLLLAIENQIGLKYLAGAPEDHLSIPFYGVEDKYKDKDPRTFGKQTLESLLKSSGFRQIRFFNAMPDYKFVTNIVSEEGCKTAIFDASTLASQALRKNADDDLFSQRRALEVVFRNGLGLELANSFVVAASQSEEPFFPMDHIAFHYSSKRQVKFFKETSFISRDGEITVKNRFPYSESSDRNSQVKYLKGKILNNDFVKIIQEDNWSIDNFTNALSRYIQELLDYARISIRDLNKVKLTGGYLDAIPKNLIVNESGYHFFDLEWDAGVDIPLSYIVFRALFCLFDETENIKSPKISSELTKRELFFDVFNKLGFKVNKTDFDHFLAMEGKFQSLVLDKPDLELSSELLDCPISGSDQKKILSKLYIKSQNEDFSEERTEINISRKDRELSLLFQLENINNDLLNIRFDPFEDNEIFSIEKFEIKNNSNDLIWKLNLEQVNLNNILFLGKKNRSLIFYSQNKDPSFIIPQSFSDQEIIIYIKIRFWSFEEFFHDLSKNEVSTTNTLTLQLENKELLLEKEKLEKQNKESRESLQTERDRIEKFKASLPGKIFNI